MVYNNDNNYAAIDYLATHRYYKLMRSSAAIININSNQQRIKTDQTPLGHPLRRIQEKCYYIF